MTQRDEAGAPPRRGRPRSERARLAVLQASSELLHEVGLRAMTTDEIASRSGVSKATIYKWWPNKYAVAVDAFLTDLEIGTTIPDTGSARADFQAALRGLTDFYSSHAGVILAQLIGESQFEPEVATTVRDRLLAGRPQLMHKIWNRGVARGELRADLDPEIAVELLTGPVLYRLFAGQEPLTSDVIDSVVDAALGGLAHG